MAPIKSASQFLFHFTLWIFSNDSSSELKGDKSKLLETLSKALPVLFAAFVIVSLSSNAQADSEEIIFDIPQQRADLALTQFAEQANRTFVFPYDKVQTETTNSLVGTFTVEEAIERLLEGTALIPEFSEEGVLTITTGVNQMNLTKRTGLIAAIAALFGASGGNAVAQNSEPETQQASQARTLEEMVVTAQKREQSLQDVPVTVNALSEDSLTEFQAQTLFDVADLVPGMVFSRAPDDGLALTLRGLGTPARTQSFDQSVALFLDNTFMGKGRMYSSAFFDVERMEVIKGTQSTLLGKNSSLGAISIVTRKPGEEFAGNVRLATELENGGFGVEGGVDIPLSDTFAVRVAAKVSDYSGWVENSITGEDVPRDKEQAVRLTGVYNPNDNLFVTAVYQNSDSERIGNGHQYVASDEVAAILPLADFGVGETVLDENKEALCVECPNGESNHDTVVDTLSLTAEYDFNTVTLTSVTALSEYEIKFFDDFDFGNTEFAGTAYSNYFERDEDYDQFSQELRLTSLGGETLDYMAGVFFFSSDWVSSEQQNWSVPNTDLPFSAPFTNNFEQETETVSVFGSSTYNFSDRMRATLGLRYTDEQKDVIFERLQGDVLGFWNTIVNPPIAATPLEFSDEFVNGNFNVQFDATESVMLYASYGVGSKTGGFAESAEIQSGDPDATVNVIDWSEEFIGADGVATDEFLAGLAVAGSRVETETAKTIEVGAKMDLLEGAANLNVALFKTDIDDFQETSFQTFLTPTDDIAALFLTRNVDAESTGVEIDGAWQATNTLRLDGGFTYADAVNALTDEDLAQAPKLTGSVGATLDFEVGDYLLSTKLVARYRDDMYSQISETFPSESLTSFDLNIGLSPYSEVWKTSLIVTNLTDEVAADFSGPAAGIVGPPGDSFVTVQAPSKTRTVSLAVTYDF